MRLNHIDQFFFCQQSQHSPKDMFFLKNGYFGKEWQLKARFIIRIQKNHSTTDQVHKIIHITEFVLKEKQICSAVFEKLEIIYTWMKQFYLTQWNLFWHIGNRSRPFVFVVDEVPFLEVTNLLAWYFVDGVSQINMNFELHYTKM